MKVTIKDQSHTDRAVISVVPDEPVDFEDVDGRKWRVQWLSFGYTSVIEAGKPTRSEAPTVTGRACSIKKNGELGTATMRISDYHGIPTSLMTEIRMVADSLDPRGLTAAVDERDAKLAELQERHDKFVARVASGMPECWGDTEDEIAAFVDSFTSGGTPGHADDCDCFGSWGN